MPLEVLKGAFQEDAAEHFLLYHIRTSGSHHWSYPLNAYTQNYMPQMHSSQNRRRFKVNYVN
jgi:hypothetical protein